MNKIVYRIISAIVAFALTFGSFASVSASSQMTTSYGKGNNASMPALQASSTRMLIPLYAYPSSATWAKVAGANLYNNIDVIINPNNGVGTSKDTSFTNGVIQLRAGNLGIYGYVYTSWGGRSLSTVKAEIDNWQLWYGVDGIFLDEADNTKNKLPYYTDLWNYITAKGMKVILNPGAGTIEDYVSVATTNIIYESDPSKALSVPSWFAKYPASEFGILQYGATVEQMRTFVSLAKSKNIGFIYVTDATAHFWSSLPPYLAEEAALLASEAPSLPGMPPISLGVFRPSDSLFYLENANVNGLADVIINYGTKGDYPVVGDWDGNGTDTIGVYRNGTFYLRNSNTPGFANLVFTFGAPGDQPVAGDWDGDGVDTIGVYRNGSFLLRNNNSAGGADISFVLGNPGDVGIIGDWNGDGLDTTGVFRPSNGVIFLKNVNTTGFADLALNYGLAGDRPVIGDWNNDGVDTIGVYRNAQFYLRNSNTIGFADLVVPLGFAGDMPIVGNWDGTP